MKKVVCIGGGTGQSALLKGLKQIDNIELSVIVAVADDGGSTGRLRNILNIPAMGDIRNCMVAMAENEDLMTFIMNYRFNQNAGELSGHSLGNIIISALTVNSGDFLQAITDLSQALNIRGNIYPSTIENVTLKAEMSDGSVVAGEEEVRDNDKQIVKVFYDGEVKAYPKVVEAIYDADYVIVGIGSLYTSILPNLIIDDIRTALCECKGKVIYYCNCMSEHGETDNYSLEDHVQAIENHLGKHVIDAVVFYNDEIPQACLDSYEKEQAGPVLMKESEHSYQVLHYPLLRFNHNVIRHDWDRIRDSFIDVMEKVK